MAISTLLRAPILVSRLATWVLAVVRPMKRSAGISAFGRPWGASAGTSSSRGGGWGAGEGGGRAALGAQREDLLLAGGERLDRLGTSGRRFPGGQGGQQP